MAINRTHGVISEALSLAVPNISKTTYTYAFFADIPPQLVQTVPNFSTTANSNSPLVIDANIPTFDSSVYSQEIELAISNVERLSALTIDESSSSEADIRIFGLDTELYLLGTSGRVGGGAYYPDTPNVGSDMFLSPRDWLGSGTMPIQYAISHELNHTVGLKDLAHVTNVDTSVFNTNRYTIMSYEQHDGLGRYVSDLQLYDIAALQSIYGRSPEGSGDTVYSNFTSQVGDLGFCIWDSGGSDTINASSSGSAALIDLRPGYFSSVGDSAGVLLQYSSDGGVAITDTGTSNISIAFGAFIEDAVGTNFGDVIVGNLLSNRLNGGGGDDVIFGDETRSFHDVGIADYRQIGIGGASAPPSIILDMVNDHTLQNDEIHGGAGNDVIYASDGHSTVFGDENNDIINVGNGTGLFDGGSGNDLLTTLGMADFETLDVGTLQGGDGRDILVNKGIAFLSGGTGDDIFYLMPGSSTAILDSDPGDVLYWNGYQITGPQNVILDFEHDFTSHYVEFGQIDSFGMDYYLSGGILSINTPDGNSISIVDYVDGDLGITIPEFPNPDEFVFHPGIPGDPGVPGTPDEPGIPSTPGVDPWWQTSLPYSNIVLNGVYGDWHNITPEVDALAAPGPVPEYTTFLV